MRMKQREDAKHERRNGLQSQSFPILAALRTADFHRVWLPEPAAADRPGEIHRVVAVSLSVDWRGNRMGDVSVLSLKNAIFAYITPGNRISRYGIELDAGRTEQARSEGIEVFDGNCFDAQCPVSRIARATSLRAASAPQIR